MYGLERIKHELASELGQLLKTEVKAVDFVLPPNANMGDLSLPGFALAKKLNQTPNELAVLIAKNFKHKFIESVVAAGPYANFTLSVEALSFILNSLQKLKTKFGINNSGQKKRIMIEYSNANTHKEYHIGHLRNLVYGDAVAKILTANGYKVIPVSYINDFGIHVAKTIWWLYHEHNTEAKAIIRQNPANKGYLLGRQYAEATKRLNDKASYKDQVANIMQQIESRHGEFYKLWKVTRRWSIEHMAKIYQELNIKFVTIFYENQFIKQGLRMVKSLQKKSILTKSDGAVIANLEKYNLGVLVVLRSDGTSLYPVADLALAVAKIKRYKLDASLYLVDVRQGLYFDQLFKLLELLGYQTKFEHLSYEFVKLPSGMMSSRTGNIIPYEDLKDLALAKAKEETAQRHPTWSKEKINQTARVIAFGALKFEMIKVSANKQIVFDVDKALRFDGFTAAYLQYTYARIKSIERKAEFKKLKVDWQKLIEVKEKSLIMKLAEFPGIIKFAGEKKDTSEIAKYLFDLAQLANDYYHAVPILKADKLTGAARLALMQSVASLIKNGLSLLGIEVIEEM